MKYFFISIIFLFFGTAYADTYVKVKVNPDQRVYFWVYNPLFTDSKVLNNSPTNAAGEASINVRNETPLTGKIMNMLIYLHPGDSILIAIDTLNRFGNGLIIKSKLFGNDLNFRPYLENHLGMPTYFTYSGAVNDSGAIRNHYNFLQNSYQKRLIILNEYKVKFGLGDQMYHLYEKEILNQYYADVYTPFLNKPTLDLNFFPEEVKSLLTKLSSKVSSDSCLYSVHYAVAVYRLSYYFTFIDPAPASMGKSFSIARNSFTGKTREHMLTYVLSRNMDEKREIFRTYYNQFKTIAKTPVYIKFADSLYTRNYNFKNIYLNNTLVKTKIFDENGKAHDFGKVLRNDSLYTLIDFWASWCIPCIAEFEPSRILIDSLKKVDFPIKYLYISVDTDKSAWLKAITKHNLKERGLHFTTGKSTDDYLKKFFVAPPIPRYVLISPSGEVVSTDNFRPSDANAIWFIKNLNK